MRDGFNSMNIESAFVWNTIWRNMQVADRQKSVIGQEGWNGRKDVKHPNLPPFNKLRVLHPEWTKSLDLPNSKKSANFALAKQERRPEKPLPDNKK